MPVVPQKSSPRLVYAETRTPVLGVVQTGREALRQAVAMPEGLRRITVLSGGVGGARFLQGLLHGIATGSLPGVAPDAEVTVIANTADDCGCTGSRSAPTSTP